MKNIALLIVLLALFVETHSRTDINHGYRADSWFVVSYDVIRKQPIPSTAVYAKFVRRYHCPIKRLEIHDQVGGNRGADVTIEHGGFDQKFIILTLVSKRGQPISTSIAVWCDLKAINVSVFAGLINNQAGNKTEEKPKDTESGHKKYINVPTMVLDNEDKVKDGEKAEDGNEEKDRGSKDKEYTTVKDTTKDGGNEAEGVGQTEKENIVNDGGEKENGDIVKDGEKAEGEN